MSEAAEPQKKKKSKLPMIIMLVVVLLGGGFFATKGKGEKAEPEVKLGAIEPLGEFLVNLSDGRTYLRAEISVHVADTKKIGAGPKHDDYTVARDAVIAVLKSKSLKQVSTEKGIAELKKEIAKAINKSIPDDDEKGKKKRKKKKKDEDEEEEEESEEEESEHDDWDSETGPALKIYFTNFATQ